MRKEDHVREINWDEPLSGDDLKWLEQRMTPELDEKVQANQKRFSKAARHAADDEVTDNYDSWKVPELKEEAEKRKIDVSGLTKKPDFIAALRTWDAENPDDDDED
jgi:hypothetical protein